MTTVSQIVTDAYQYNNIVALSVIPTAAEQAKALRYLNRIFSGIFGNEVGEQLTPWNIGKANVTKLSNEDQCYLLNPPYLVPSNARLILNLTEAIVGYLPAMPQDGQRFAIQDLSGNLLNFPFVISGNGRLIENQPTLSLNVNGTNAEWFFRADLGTWVKFSQLALTDEFPLPAEFEEYFITMLAIRLGASEDIDLNNQLGIVLKEATKKLRARYSQSVEVGAEDGLVRTLSNRLGHNSGTRFDHG